MSDTTNTRNERIARNIAAAYYMFTRGARYSAYVWKTALKRHNGDANAAAADLAKRHRARHTKTDVCPVCHRYPIAPNRDTCVDCSH